ncbi:MAG TPA: hypothetical protein VJV77_11270 [Casimicrobiaceae bacterium]|nr:hypothetical protein [Casimicrobiaceae bacterium]
MENNDWRNGDAHRELPFKPLWIADLQDDDRAGVAAASDRVDAASDAERVALEYRAAADAGIHCVREAVGWRQVERAGGFDFAKVLARAEMARRHGIAIAWTLCRGDWPDDVDVLSTEFVERVRSYADATARALHAYASAVPPVYAPFEEIAFLAYCVAETGLLNPWQRDRQSRGDDVQRQLVKAAIAVCDAIAAVDPRTRFLHVETMPRVRPAEQHGAAAAWRTFDLLSGRADGARGHPRYLDVIGVNCHASRETAARTLVPLPGVRGARRRVPVAQALAAIADRYGRPIVVGEHSPAGVNRAAWLSEIGDGVREAQHAGVSVVGVCLRPGRDRPLWRDPLRWQAFGLWDRVLAPSAAAPADRGYAKSLAMMRARVQDVRAPSGRNAP